MKSKKKTLLSAICAIVLCMSLIAGSTFALFTSESKVNIAVTSGQVKVTATVDELTTYSVVAVNDDYDTDAEDYAGQATAVGTTSKYRYVAQIPAGTFSESGTAVYNDGTLTLSKMIPGDKVNFDVKVANESNVNIKYRVIVTVTSGLKLFNALKVKIDGTSLTGVSRTGAWTSLAANNTANPALIQTIPVEIYMPVETGNEYNDKELSTAMTISVEAVQGNAKTVDGTLTSTIETEPVEVAVSGSKTTAAISPISDSDNLVTVTIPKDTILTTETDTSLMVKVTPQDTVSNAVITVLNNNPAKASASYDVSVLKVVNTTEGDETTTTISDAIASNNDKPITVEMFVGAGLKGVELYHYDDVSGVTTPIIVFDYDIDSGYITFETTSFSEYTVVYNKDYAVETDTGIVVYEATEIAGVYEDTKTGEVVTVANDNVMVLFAGGSGTENDPYQIANRNEFENISYVDTYAYYKWVGESVIDASDWSSSNYLCGSFDGNGVTFNNLDCFLFRAVWNGSESWMPSEDIVNTYTIKNLTVNANIVTDGWIAGIVRVAGVHNFVMENVTVHGYIEGATGVASFICFGAGNYVPAPSYSYDGHITFINCNSDAIIVAKSGYGVGFIAHAMTATAAATVTLENSNFTGTISGAAKYVCGNWINASITDDQSSEKNNLIYKTSDNGWKYIAEGKTGNFTIKNGTLPADIGDVFTLDAETNATRAVISLVISPNPGCMTSTYMTEEVEVEEGKIVSSNIKYFTIRVNPDGETETGAHGNYFDVVYADFNGTLGANTIVRITQYDNSGAIISITNISFNDK